MLFTLVKNELIKMFSRTKTWIVMALFAVLISGLGFIAYKEAKSAEYYNSPQGRIESLTRQKEYNDQRLKEIENNTENWAKEETNSLNLHNEEIIKDIAKQQEIIDRNDVESWKLILSNEKEEFQKRLNEGNLSASEKEHCEERIKEIDSNLEKNEKPIESWDFDAFNYAEGVIKVLGMVIMVAGIAVFMSDIVSGESTPPTLKFLLVQPITRGKVILSKFIAVVITVVGLIGGLEIIAFGVVGAIGGFKGAELPVKLGIEYAWDYNNLSFNGMPTLAPVSESGVMATKGTFILQGFALQILFIVACCAFVFLISSIFKSSMITMALSVIISVVATISCAISQSAGKIAHLLFFNYGMTGDVITGNVAEMYKNPNFSLGLGITLMIGTIMVSYVLAHIVFSKKDILA